jgi:hypothetical protein
MNDPEKRQRDIDFFHICNYILTLFIFLSFYAIGKRMRSER